MDINRTGLTRSEIWFVIAAVLVLAFFIYANYSDLGNEKDSLLDYSCYELENWKISREGTDGRFVKDWASHKWVDKELKEEAKEVKGCINKYVDKFHYMVR